MKKLTPKIIFRYTDTQLLEIYQGVCLSMVNPVELVNLTTDCDKCSYLFLTMAILSLFCGIPYILATLLDSLWTRMYASLIYWLICCCILALLVQCHANLSPQFVISYTIQTMFALYIHLRLSREYNQRIKNGTR